MKIDTDEIVKHIMLGELIKAAEGLSIGAKYTDYELDVALLSARLNSLTRDIDRDTIEKSEANIERNKITASLLGVVDKLKADFIKNEILYDKLQFFESPAIKTPVAERKYVTTFKTAKTQYIGWELTMKYPKTPFPLMFLMEWQVLKSDGKPLMLKMEKEIKIVPDWTVALHSALWGSEKLGNWQVGNYTLQIFLNDEIVISNAFSVV